MNTSTVHSGVESEMTTDIGIDGDYFITTDTRRIFKKKLGVWTDLNATWEDGGSSIQIVNIRISNESTATVTE